MKKIHLYVHLFRNERIMSTNKDCGPKPCLFSARYSQEPSKHPRHCGTHMLVAKADSKQNSVFHLLLVSWKKGKGDASLILYQLNHDVKGVR